MSAFLVPLDPGLCLIPLEKAIVLIGRQADCDVSLTHSRKVSRKHCCIAQVNNSYVIRDLGSTNGVFVNGARVRKETGLALGDELAIGDVRFRLQSEATSPKNAKDVRPVVPRSTSLAPPSTDMPVAIPEVGQEFVVEASIAQMRPIKHRKADLEFEPEDDVVPLASSDSF
ncbi:MAG: FHA domain-containing protein [Planctomycetes bacterium]|nr:FHA domain-containing protein [Planctomycetota bacterium]